jgi:N-acyl-D-amino-acid deacylase
LNDIEIRNASVCDGTGRAPFHGSVGVRDGMITEIGRVESGAKQVIDAGGLTLSPGFIDPHTHYDAQMSWDPLCSPSSEHGVTTVLMGNCGVGLAPVRQDLKSREVLAWHLVNIESISIDLVLHGVNWVWEDFGQYMKAMLANGLALNPIFLVPHMALRLYVLGEEALERPATPAESERMCGLLRDAMRAGAAGFSINRFAGHQGYQGRTNASMLANREEILALARVMREFPGGVLEANTSFTAKGFVQEDIDLFAEISALAGRAVIIPGGLWFPGYPDDWADRQMEQVNGAAKAGGKLISQISTRPFQIYQDFRQPMVWAELPCFAERVINQPVETQLAAYRDPAFRQRFRDEQKTHGVLFQGQWDLVTISGVEKPENHKFMGMHIAELAKTQNKDPVGTILDLALDEGGTLAYTHAFINSNPREIERLLDTPGIQIGQSDAGAHIAQFCNAGYAGVFIQEWVNKRGKYTIEQAVARVTSEHADLFGLRQKGRIAVGKDADLVLFDPKKINASRAQRVQDLPSGGHRFVERAEGISHIVVNGQVTFKDGVHQGPLPGRIATPG